MEQIIAHAQVGWGQMSAHAIIVQASKVYTLWTKHPAVSTVPMYMRYLLLPSGYLTKREPIYILSVLCST